MAWVNGADTGSLLAGLAAVADAAGLTDDDSGRGITDAAATVRHWLETDGDRCLLVFDDVSDPEALQEFVPAHGTARVLITSTRQSAANLGSAVPVDVFSAAEASAFLAGRTGLDDEAGAAAVAAELGYLPLALALAAPVISGAAPRVCEVPGPAADDPGRSIPDRGRRPAVPAQRRAGGAAVPCRRSGRPTRRACAPGSWRSWRYCRRPGSAASYCMSPGGRASWPAAGVGSRRPWWIGCWNGWATGRC